MVNKCRNSCLSNHCVPSSVNPIRLIKTGEAMLSGSSGWQLISKSYSKYILKLFFCSMDVIIVPGFLSLDVTLFTIIHPVISIL